MPKPKTGAQPISEQFGAKEGDEVRVICSDAVYCGMLLPRQAKSDEFITLKLDSGYNIGIQISKISKIEIIHKAAKKEAITQHESQKQKFSEKVALLSCGGTIASRIDYRTGAVYPALTPSQLLAGIPKADQIAPKMLFSVASEDLSPQHWVKIAQETHSAIKEGAIGVVITHGTDTMHYTSAALSFMLICPPCPIVLTGSQRSSDRGSSDAPINLSAAILAAKADLAGVFICMHEGLSDDRCSLIFGTKARKMHTSRRDAFRSINVSPAATIHLDSGKVEKISELCKSRAKTSDFKLDTKLNTNVAIQYIYPGIKPSAIAALSSYDGVVLVGTGLGHLPINLSNDPLAMPILKEVCALLDSGVAVYLASQCIYGRVNMNVYTNGRVLLEKGIMGHQCDMTPETAYVKLMWVLGHEKNPKKVKELMEMNLVGEISPKSELTGY
ncbi:MAG: Glu-tRNA(Gln) amidotransferase subunit GatD [Candidatus Micrarchaeota archaeon]|nr:Glu-tRNA(Gln) amidotransferase subunit GatD [Candidatus Micrarchaeota archaeon]